MTDLKVSQTLASILVGALTLALSSPVKAASFSFRGSLSVNDPVQFFSFTTSTDSTVTLKTFSYAGGTQADGTVVLAGGFDPIVSLFDGNSSPNILLDSNGDSFNVSTDPVTASFDSFLTQNLGPGQYTVTLSQAPNVAPFSIQYPYNYATGQYNRTDNWNLDILNVDSASTTAPQAISVPLAGL
jgi:hypothetical protein